MDSAASRNAIGPAERHLRVYLLSGATFWVYWLAATLIVVIGIFAGSVTRFAPGATMPETYLAVIVVADPEKPAGEPRVLRVRQLAEFRKRYPAASLVPPLVAERTLIQRPDERLDFHVVYSARQSTTPGLVEVITRTSVPLIDSPGSFGYLKMRYRVGNASIEPVVSVAFDPFLSWFVAAFLCLFVTLIASASLDWLMIKRPLARGRWPMRPPLSRDWLVTHGIPLRFESSPKSLEGPAEALRRIGASVVVQADQAALRAELGRRAVLTANVTTARTTSPVCEVLIDGARTTSGTLLLTLVAPAAGLGAVALALFELLDPFSAWNRQALPIIGLACLAVASIHFGRRIIGASGVSDEADRLATALIESLEAQGACSVPPPRWPRVKPPMPRWRRWLPWILFGLLLLATLGSMLFSAVIDR